MTIFINPGSGPVVDTSEEHAIENIKHFITDCNVKDLSWIRIPEKDYGEGRYAFLLWKDTRCHEVQIPGLPLDKVRYMDEESQNIWNFPRLYVDDSSYVWKYALYCEKDFELTEN